MRRSDDTWLTMLLLLVAVGSSGARRRARTAPLWTDDEMFVFAGYVRQTGVPVEVALAVYTAESGLNPRATSGIGFGLAQMTAATLRDLGWSEPAKAFLDLGVADQSPWIAKLLQYQIKSIGFIPMTATDLYVTNLSPAAARARADIIYKQGSQEYAKNSRLDRAGKGYISRDDLDRVMTAAQLTDTYLLAVEQLKRVIA